MVSRLPSAAVRAVQCTIVRDRIRNPIGFRDVSRKGPPPRLSAPSSVIGIAPDVRRVVSPSSSIDGLHLLFGSCLIAFFGFFAKEEKEESALVTQIKRGILAMQKSELDKAERIFHVALKTAQDLNEEDGVTYIYDMLANVAFQREEYKKAEQLFTDVLSRALHQKKLAENHNAVVEISLKLAKCFEMQSEMRKAELGYQFCLQKQGEKVAARGLDITADTKLLWAKASDWYAHFLMSEDRYAEAEPHFRTALFVSEEVNGNDHPQTLVIMNDLAAVLHLLGKDEEAIELLRQSIAIGKKMGVEDLPTYYVNLGAIHLSRDMAHLAEHACRSALNLAVKMGDTAAEREAKHCLNGVRDAREREKNQKPVVKAAGVV